MRFDNPTISGSSIVENIVYDSYNNTNKELIFKFTKATEIPQGHVLKYDISVNLADTNRTTDKSYASRSYIV